MEYTELGLAKLELSRLQNEKDPSKKVIIYPLTKEGKLIRDKTPFAVPANATPGYVKSRLNRIGVYSGRWYGADEDEALPERYY